MPGYNHYSDCTCGWCQKFSSLRGSYDPTADNARVSLQELGFNGSWSSCFVRPNARCPVCFAAVFYYSNSSGSSVYFDELGWPWPKHPCTDHPKCKATGAVSAQPVRGRKRGEIDEVGGALVAVGTDPKRSFRERYASDPWEPYIVLAIVRLGFDNHLKLESIMAPGDMLHTTFVSAKTTVAVRDLVSAQPGRICVLLPDFSSKVFTARTLAEPEYLSMFDRSDD